LLAASLLKALRNHGAREVFGVPGDFALPLFDAIESTGLLALHTLSHEPSAGFAADAAARIRGTIGVVAATYGAGALNLVNPIAAAYAEKSPVVVLSGAPGARERKSGLLVHHQARTLDSQFAIYREITCAQERLDDPARAPAQIARALACARRWSRPVYIEIPRDMAARPCGDVAVEDEPAIDAEAIATCADEVFARLAGARRPVLMVGVEVRRFGLEAKVAALARALGIPVVTSFMGRGLLTGTETALAGTYLGAAGDREVTALVEESDGLILLGVIVSDTNFGVSAARVDLRRAIHAFDRCVSLSHHTYAEVPLAELVDALLERARPLAAAPAPPAARLPRGLADSPLPIGYGEVAAGLNDLIAAHGKFPIAADVGESLFLAMDLEPTDYVAPGYYAGMGFGVPAALGLQAATGRRRMGARALPPLRLGSDRGGAQQLRVGDAVGVPAAGALHRSRRLGFRPRRRGHRWARPARADAGRVEARTGVGSERARALPAHRRAHGSGRNLAAHARVRHAPGGRLLGRQAT
jgi:indolepyruvate decarboxylase